jgi:hypothetical protein
LPKVFYHSLDWPAAPAAQGRLKQAQNGAPLFFLRPPPGKSLDFTASLDCYAINFMTNSPPGDIWHNFLNYKNINLKRRKKID